MKQTYADDLSEVLVFVPQGNNLWSGAAAPETGMIHLLLKAKKFESADSRSCGLALMYVQGFLFFFFYRAQGVQRQTH